LHEFCAYFRVSLPLPLVHTRFLLLVSCAMLGWFSLRLGMLPDVPADSLTDASMRVFGNSPIGFGERFVGVAIAVAILLITFKANPMSVAPLVLVTTVGFTVRAWIGNQTMLGAFGYALAAFAAARVQPAQMVRARVLALVAGALVWHATHSYAQTALALTCIEFARGPELKRIAAVLLLLGLALVDLRSAPAVPLGLAFANVAYSLFPWSALLPVVVAERNPSLQLLALGALALPIAAGTPLAFLGWVPFALCISRIREITMVSLLASCALGIVLMRDVATMPGKLFYGFGATDLATKATCGAMLLVVLLVPLRAYLARAPKLLRTHTALLAAGAAFMGHGLAQALERSSPSAVLEPLRASARQGNRIASLSVEPKILRAVQGTTTLSLSSEEAASAWLAQGDSTLLLAASHLPALNASFRKANGHNLPVLAHADRYVVAVHSLPLGTRSANPLDHKGRCVGSDKHRSDPARGRYFAAVAGLGHRGRATWKAPASALLSPAHLRACAFETARRLRHVHSRRALAVSARPRAHCVRVPDAVLGARRSH
jgi:hypothetical protein